MTAPTGVTDLLAAVLEALDIPQPATEGDGELHDRILLERVGHAVIALRSIVHDPHACAGWTADYLRNRLAEIPATGYRTAGQDGGDRL